jgi:hypothetical protein
LRIAKSGIAAGVACRDMTGTDDVPAVSEFVEACPLLCDVGTLLVRKSER